LKLEGNRKERDMRIYISGPITNKLDYMEDFDRAEQKLLSQGHEVINPAKINSFLPKDTTHEQYMTFSFMLLDMADTIYMLSGWRCSSGSCMEYEYARAKNKIIVEDKVCRI
jgi:nucleoside 2-deoxyribosyltransferase